MRGHTCCPPSPSPCVQVYVFEEVLGQGVRGGGELKRAIRDNREAVVAALKSAGVVVGASASGGGTTAAEPPRMLWLRHNTLAGDAPPGALPCSCGHAACSCPPHTLCPDHVLQGVWHVHPAPASPLRLVAAMTTGAGGSSSPATPAVAPMSLPKWVATHPAVRGSVVGRDGGDMRQPAWVQQDGASCIPVIALLADVEEAIMSPGGGQASFARDAIVAALRTGKAPAALDCCAGALSATRLGMRLRT